MSSLIALSGVFFAGTLIVWALTRSLISYARSRSLIDIPNQRSSHVTPTPRGGGFSIAIWFLAALSILFALDRIDIAQFCALFGGGGLVAAIGFWDDHQHLGPGRRILVHFCAAAWSLAWIGGFPALSVAGQTMDFGLLGYPIGALFLVWLLNLFNFMDGIDGIAGSEALFVCLAAALFCIALRPPLHMDGIVHLLVALAAGCAGFLIWNWPPASIFMGDAGSGFLGFVLGLMALISAHQETISLWSWFILFGIFLTDATFTLLRRILRGEQWYRAHRSHAYQHAARLLASHRTVTLGVTLINILWILPLAAAAAVWTNAGILLAILAFIPLLVLANRLRAGIV